MNIELISKGLSHISSISILIPLILCIIKYKAFNNQLKALFIYIIISITIEIISFLSINNSAIWVPISYSFSIIETSLITAIFYQEWDNKFLKKNTLYLYSFFILMSFVTLIVTKSITSAENITLPLEFGIITTFSIIHFHKVFTDLTIPKLTDYHFFWLNSAFILYFGTNFLLTLFYSYIKTSNVEVMYLLGCIPLIMSVTYNILLALGIWKFKRV